MALSTDNVGAALTAPRHYVRVVKEMDLKSIGFARAGSNPAGVVSLFLHPPQLEDSCRISFHFMPISWHYRLHAAHSAPYAATTHVTHVPAHSLLSWLVGLENCTTPHTMETTFCVSQQQCSCKNLQPKSLGQGGRGITQPMPLE